ncbi:hypothetical protein MTR_8g028605 [Medicago truncatula]|uniref:Uncharacterized protein n=1 Tax=Medicago truncatula TaxID=3880 RepID=A0A072TN14_MEDTR|nr:hypothetical protein MTR_8g028605 [Medicago truncatula]
MRPTVEANNFELKPYFPFMAQQNQFFCVPTDDPNLHLAIFLEYCDTFKKIVANDAVSCRFFPISQSDRAIT